MPAFFVLKMLVAHRCQRIAGLLYLFKKRWCLYTLGMRRVRLRIKEVAEEKGISMTKLHIRSEVAYATIRKIFRDPYSEVTVTTLARLGEVLGVPTRDLIEDEEE